MYPGTKRVLFLAPVRDSFAGFRRLIESRPGVERVSRPRAVVWRWKALDLEICTTHSAEDARRRLATGYFNLVVIDCRHPHADDADALRQEQVLRGFLDQLGHEPSLERAYPFDRICVLVGDRNEDRVDRLIFELGRRHVGLCLRDGSIPPHRSEKERVRLEGVFADRFLEFCRRTLLEKKEGKKAISAAGGGISGIYYELGVLKCLHDAFDVDIRDFDMYLGISAGAIVTSCIANGMGIDDLIANIGGIRSEWPAKLQLGWRHLNWRELPERIWRTHLEVLGTLKQMIRGETEPSLFSLLWSCQTILPPIFDNTRLEEVMRELFSAPGRTNRFDELRAELYIGATDQDRRVHVLFGDEAHRDVPISRAIQASSAAHPYFRSVTIDGPRYTDGILTRTSNVSVAIERGADLVFILDPFVPMISEEPGFAARQGSLWLVEQDVKTLAFTRFAQVLEEVLRRNPHVSAYTFVPSRRMRRLMAQNAFVALNFHPIVCEAYRSTYRRLRQLEYKIRGDLRAHGIELDLTIPDRRVAILRGRRKADARVLLDPIDLPTTVDGARAREQGQDVTPESPPGSSRGFVDEDAA